MPIITEELLDTVKTRRGGFKHDVLRALGVKIIGAYIEPWKRRMLGTYMSDRRWAKVVAASLGANENQQVLFDMPAETPLPLF